MRCCHGSTYVKRMTDLSVQWVSCRRPCYSGSVLSFGVILVGRIPRNLYTVFSIESTGGRGGEDVTYDRPKAKKDILNVVKRSSYS